MSYKYNHFTLSCIFITYTLTLTAVQDMEIQILMTHPALRLPFSNQMLFRERLFPTTIAPISSRNNSSQLWDVDVYLGALMRALYSVSQL